MRRVVPLLIVLCLGFAPAPVYREKPIPESMKVMQGSWAIREWGTAAMQVPVFVQRGAWAKKGGEEIPISLPSSAEVAGCRMVFSRNGKDATRWLLNAVADWGVAGSGVLEIVEARGGGKMMGIYKLEGDTLTICYRDQGRGRPAGFTKDGQWVLVLKRKKP
jgi:uncharacterized protein (TIGR03067 family)